LAYRSSTVVAPRRLACFPIFDRRSAAVEQLPPLSGNVGRYRPCFS